MLLIESGLRFQINRLKLMRSFKPRRKYKYEVLDEEASSKTRRGSSYEPSSNTAPFTDVVNTNAMKMVLLPHYRGILDVPFVSNLTTTSNSPLFQGPIPPMVRGDLMPLASRLSRLIETVDF